MLHPALRRLSNKVSIFSCFSFSLLFYVSLFPQLVFGEAGSGRGLLTSSTCPLSCEDLKVPLEHCRSFRNGKSCVVEDLRYGPGHRSLIRVNHSKSMILPSSRARMKNEEPPRERSVSKLDERRGLVTSTVCPYTCSDAGLSSDSCIERRVGNRCEIEDFTQAAGHRSLLRVE